MQKVILLAKECVTIYIVVLGEAANITICNNYLIIITIKFLRAHLEFQCT